MMEYVDPTDQGRRYVAEYLSGSLWDTATVRWAIVDRNTGEYMLRGRDHQPHNKGKRIWRGTKDQAQWWCDQLNDNSQAMGTGSGPDMQARRVNVGAITAHARNQAAVPTFVSCEACSRCHRAGACAVS
jgi:hypothetical protein